MSEAPLYFLSDRMKPLRAENCSRNRLKGILSLLYGCSQALVTSVLWFWVAHGGGGRRPSHFFGEFIDYKTSMITDEDPLRGLLFY